MRLSKEVKDDLRAFVSTYMEQWQEDAREYDEMSITFATTDGKTWGFQTGDNSFTGGAYGFKHWAVISVYPEMTAEGLVADMFEQFSELMAEEAMTGEIAAQL